MKENEFREVRKHCDQLFGFSRGTGGKMREILKCPILGRAKIAFSLLKFYNEDSEPVRVCLKQKSSLEGRFFEKRAMFKERGNHSGFRSLR